MKNKLSICFKLSEKAQAMEMLEQCNENNLIVAGFDEAGRGPLAGPVVAACVVMPENSCVLGLADSKKLSPLNRDKLFFNILHSEAVCGIGIVGVNEIDKINIFNATFLAMRRALESLRVIPNLVLVDGNKPIKDIDYYQVCIVSGDSYVPSIQAASILAKVTRDKIMRAYEHIYPHYGFYKHKGYPTKVHIQAIKDHGPCHIHRRIFVEKFFIQDKEKQCPGQKVNTVRN